MNTPKYVRETSSDPWAILIALASLIIVATATAIFVIIILWKKYQKNRLLFERNFLGVSYELSRPQLPPPPPMPLPIPMPMPLPIPMPVPMTVAMPLPIQPAAPVHLSMSSDGERDPKEYEDQTLDMFVPLEDRDDLGEVHIGFSTKGGIQSIHHVKEVATKSGNEIGPSDGATILPQ